MKKRKTAKKTRLPKLPKAPKAKASLKVWKAYAKKVHEHQKVVAEIKHARKILCSPSFAFPEAPAKPRHRKPPVTHAQKLRDMGLVELAPRKSPKKKKKIPAGMYGSPREWHRKMLAAKKRKAALRMIEHRGMYAGMR